MDINDVIVFHTGVPFSLALQIFNHYLSILMIFFFIEIHTNDRMTRCLTMEMELE